MRKINTSNKFIRGTFSTFTLKCVGIGLSFFTNFLLARILGVAEYGVYVYVMSLMNIFCVGAIFGLDNLLIRQVAVYQTTLSWRIMKGLLRWSNGIVLMASVSIIILANLIIAFVPLNIDSQVLSACKIALLLLPLMALLKTRQAALLGLKKIFNGQLIETVISPVLCIIFIILLSMQPKDVLKATSIVAINILTGSISLLIVFFILKRSLPEEIKNVNPIYNTRGWISSAFPLFVLTSLYAINAQTDTILLGLLKGKESVGIYAIVAKLAMPLSFILLVTNTVIGPRIAGFYATKNTREMQLLITRVARLILILTIPLALILILLGQWFLLLFGQEFVIGKTALIIYSIGQIINAGMGPVGLLLIMTGNEKEAVVGISISVFVNILMCLILIPKWGLAGAAFANVVSVFSWNSLLTYFVYKKLDINASVFAGIGSLKS